VFFEKMEDYELKGNSQRYKSLRGVNCKQISNKEKEQIEKELDKRNRLLYGDNYRRFELLDLR
jgi:hypothetical protein